MTWSELREYLETENEKYRAGEEARTENVTRSTEPAAIRRARRLAGEFAARHAIDEACRHFAAKGSWPAMNADATLYAHDRWIFAIWFSRWLDEMGSLNAGDEEHENAEWLIWLLVEAWDEIGSWRWRSSQKPPVEK